MGRSQDALDQPATTSRPSSVLDRTAPGVRLKRGAGAVVFDSGRSQVDFVQLIQDLGQDVSTCNSVLEAYTHLGQPLVTHIAISAQHSAVRLLAGAPISVNVCVVDRAGQIIGHAE